MKTVVCPKCQGLNIKIFSPTPVEQQSREEVSKIAEQFKKPVGKS